MQGSITYRELVSGPDLGHVEWIEAQLEGISLLWLHDLHVCCIGDLVSTFDGFPELLFRVIWVDTGQLDGLLTSEGLLPTIRKEVVFDIDELAFFVDPDRSR